MFSQKAAHGLFFSGSEKLPKPSFVGARNVDNILTNTLLPEISRQLLTRIAEGQKLESIQVNVGPDGAFVYS